MKQFLSEAKRNLGEVKKYLTEAKQLTDQSSSLIKLKKAIPIVTAKVNEYEQLINQTIEKNELIAQDRMQMNTAAQNFVKENHNYLSSQNETLMAEITSAEKQSDINSILATVRNRLPKINIPNDINDAGNDIRIAFWKSQSLRDPKLILDILPQFDVITKSLDDLKARTKQDINLKQIAIIREAINSYKKKYDRLACQQIGIAGNRPKTRRHSR